MDICAFDGHPIWPIARPIIRAGRTYTFDPQMDEATFIATWTAPEKSVFVAVDGDVLGTYYLRPDVSGVPGRCNAGFMVAPAAAGRGVGTALAHHALEQARAQGFVSMWFNEVVADNPALRLWQRLGFEVVKEHEGPIQDGQPMRLVQMMRPL